MDAALEAPVGLQRAPGGVALRLLQPAAGTRLDEAPQPAAGRARVRVGGLSSGPCACWRCGRGERRSSRRALARPRLRGRGGRRGRSNGSARPGWVDDLAAARSAVRLRGARYGRARVERELKARGLSKDVIAAAFEAEGGAGAGRRGPAAAFAKLWSARANLGAAAASPARVRRADAARFSAGRRFLRSSGAAMKANDVRERFLSFFEERGHRRVPSSSLIPAEDPTLLFTNAGMNQFKDVFTGREKREYRRATSSQKCVRAGGKHNDLDNVGYTGRHQTFFEMLGNFSFGDYFKDEAIRFAWELVTDREKGYGLDPERLWATVYTEDDEAAKLWERHLPAGRGSCASARRRTSGRWGRPVPAARAREIHYFRGGDLSQNTRRARQRPRRRDARDLEPRLHAVRARRVREADAAAAPVGRHRRGPRAGRGDPRRASTTTSTPTSSRRSSARIEELSGRTYRGGMAPEDAPFRVIADHVRAATMLIADGVLPSNEGRGYVLRRILRRAIRYGRRLGLNEPFLYRLAPVVIEGFAGVYFEPAKDGGRRTERGGRPSARGRALRPNAFRGRRPRRRGDRAPAPRGRDRAVRATPSFASTTPTGSPWRSSRRSRATRASPWTGPASRRRWSISAPPRAPRPGSRRADASVYERLELPPEHSVFRGYPEQDFVALSGAQILGHREGRPGGLGPGDGRDRRRRRGPDDLLSGGRRPDRRHGKLHLGRRIGRGDRRAEAGAEPDRAPRPRPRGPARARAGRGHGGPRMDPPPDPGQPHRHAPAACGAPARSRGDGEADGFVRRAGQAAVRLRGRRADHGRAALRDRAARQPGDPPRPAGLEAGHGDGRRPAQGRRHVFRREVRRARARGRGPGILDRALRRLPCAPHGRDRRVQDRVRPRDPGRGPAPRGRDVARRGRAPRRGRARL